MPRDLTPERLPTTPEEAVPGRFAARRPTTPKSKTDPDALLPKGVFVPSPSEEE